MVRVPDRRPVQRGRGPRGRTSVALPETQPPRFSCPAGPGAIRRYRVSPPRAFRIRMRGLLSVVLHGDRKSRIAFAEEMPDAAFSFPQTEIKEVAALVLSAARARNGWRLIREATMIRRPRRRSLTTVH